MNIYRYVASRPLASFQKHQLLPALQRIGFVDDVTVAAWFWVLADALTPKELDRLAEVLDGALVVPTLPNLPSCCLRVLVAPREGTISPFSSRAVDIACQCGLQAIERIEMVLLYELALTQPLSELQQSGVIAKLHDPMTQAVCFSIDSVDQLLLKQKRPAEMATVSLAQESAEHSSGLSDEELAYWINWRQNSGRDPTDAEWMMFAQVNSEHCRHKIFNARWTIDGESELYSLFDMIRHTAPGLENGVLSAYRDNGAVLEGYPADSLLIEPGTGRYRYRHQPMPIVIKVETHNHPTAVSPFPGAATGAGGEIRDEGAVGVGGRPKAGLVGFSVSDLCIPNFTQPWELEYPAPAHMASALDIMLQGPIGAAAFNNEFGRPGICGYFRTFSAHMKNREGAVRGYHKPIMIAGGLGHVALEHVGKQVLPASALLIVLGGPAMRIGMGGGAASSMVSGAQDAHLDFASVQRANPEMQRRCQEVINACASFGSDNPILSIHDVGAGGVSNALPELLHDSGHGGVINLDRFLLADASLSPAEIWCNESQERYVLAIAPDHLELFEHIASRERCPFSVVGRATADSTLLVESASVGKHVVDLPLDFLFGKPPRLHRDVTRLSVEPSHFSPLSLDLEEAASRVLHLATVADKSFLVTIADRTLGAMVARDQMVGPWQVPVSDVAVTMNTFTGYTGEAMAMGERPIIALIHPAASARMAVGEAITNIAAAPISRLEDIKLSANWMAACGYPGEDAHLFDAVKAVALELCPALGISIPVGKDSLSMRSIWQESGMRREVVAPLSLIVSAFAPVADVRKTLTPLLRSDLGETDLLLIDLGAGEKSLGGSALAQVFGTQGDLPPDLDDPARLRSFFEAIQHLNQSGDLLAYHDRSDGGLFVTLCEMAFASHLGLSVDLSELGDHPIEILFSEDLGAVLQVRRADTARILFKLNASGLQGCCHVVGHPNQRDQLEFFWHGNLVLSKPRTYWQRMWSETSFRMQSLRDDPDCAQQWFESISKGDTPGLNVAFSFDPNEDIAAPYINLSVRPCVAVLREQGVNGYAELAAAFDRAGFDVLDLHMTDLSTARRSLRGVIGLAAAGGFSYGDVLGAGRGWAYSILYNDGLRSEFEHFFSRSETFTIGLCNGCQMLSHLRELIPGSSTWPTFVRNQSQQFESRLVLLEILDSSSIFTKNMVGSRLCVPVAHGEGRAHFSDSDDALSLMSSGQIVARYVDAHGLPTQDYPANPNGSPLGIAAVTSQDGRVMLMMPHPERVFRAAQYSWHPAGLMEDGPTLRLFRNARVWVS